MATSPKIVSPLNYNHKHNMAIILTRLSDGSIQRLDTSTQVIQTYTGNRCRWHTDQVADITHFYYEDQLLGSVADDPTLFPGNTIFGSATSTAAQANLTSLGVVTAGGSSGGPAVSAPIDLTPATIAQITPGLATDVAGTNTVIGQLKRLVQLGTDDKDLAELVLQETTGLKRIVVRRSVYDEPSASYITSFVDVNGSVLVPPVVLPVGPLDTGANPKELVSFEYNVVTAGTGYAVSDNLQQVNIVDINTSTVTATLWFNRSTQTVLAAPPLPARIQPVKDKLEQLTIDQTDLTGWYRIRQKYIAKTATLPDINIGDLIEAEDLYRGSAFVTTVYTNINTGLTYPGVGQAYPNWVPIEYDILNSDSNQAIIDIRDQYVTELDPVTAPYSKITNDAGSEIAQVQRSTPGPTVPGLVVRQTELNGFGETQKIASTPFTAVFSRLTDGSNLALLRLGTPFSTDAGLVVRQVPNTLSTPFFNSISDGVNSASISSTLPAITDLGLTVKQSIVDTAGNTAIVGRTQPSRVYVQQTDGTLDVQLSTSLPSTSVVGVPVRQAPDVDGNTQTVSSTLGTALFSRITDGTNSLPLLAAIPPAATIAVPVRQVPNTLSTPFFNSISNGSRVADVSSILPANTVSGLVVRQAPDAVGNTQTISSTAGTALFSRITNGTIEPVITAASVLPVPTDPALVVSLSPNSASLSVRSTYNTGLPVLTAGTSAPLQADSRGRVFTTLGQATTQFGTTSPQPDIALPAGKKLFRVSITNNTGTVFFFQIHNSGPILGVGSVPINGHIYRIPGNTTVILDEAVWSVDGEVVSPNSRLAFSSTFVNYTPVSGAVLSNVSLNYKIEA